MARARGSGVVEEKEGTSSFEDLFLDWDGPDLIFKTVSDWSNDFDGHCEKSTVANFFQYFLSAFANNIEEVYELKLWMLNLVAHYVAVNENWFDTADDSRYWRKLFLSEEVWEVPPPS